MDAERMIAEARKAFFVMFGFLVVIWTLQVLNWIDGYALSREYGVVGGDVSRLPEIFTSPFLHWSWEHIESNSGPLFVFGFLAAYRGVRRFVALSLLVAVTSGMAVWLFQGGDVDTVGASGLIFGYFGYVVVRGLFDRHLIDMLIGFVMAGSFAYLLTVAVPGTPGVSWVDHLGGLAGGILGGWILRDRTRASWRRGGGGSWDTAEDEADETEEAAEVEETAAGSPRADLHKELGDLGLL